MRFVAQKRKLVDENLIFEISATALIDKNVEAGTSVISKNKGVGGPKEVFSLDMSKLGQTSTFLGDFLNDIRLGVSQGASNMVNPFDDVTNLVDVPVIFNA